MLAIKVDYDGSCFDDETIHNFLGHFDVVIDAAIKNPRTNVLEISLLNLQERQKILIDWNKTEMDYPKDKTVYQLFEDQVKRTPNNIAAVFEGKELSYAELNKKANQVAGYIKRRYKDFTKKEIMSDVLIGICMERSLDMIIGILGILKVGGAYVPIDPAYPQERINYIMEDAGVQLILMQEKILKQLECVRENKKILALCIDRNENMGNHCGNSSCVVGEEKRLAYVIYTSGSTGTPKGVMISHGNVSNYIHWAKSYLNFRECDRVDCSSSFSFDLTVTVSLLPLLCGATVIFCTDEIKQNPHEYYKYLKDNDINVIKLTPSYFAVLNLVECNLRLRECKKVILGGEILEQKSVKAWLANNPTDTIFNEYGPTETTVGVSQYAINIINIDTFINAIGKPANNTKIYILDEKLKPVPIGVIGELFVGGESVAQGYLSHADLTDQKFISNPLGVIDETLLDKNVKLYKTGDLARWSIDGVLEYIGRKDEQVKIRGFRVEPGEVEIQLTKNSSIQRCVVTVFESAKQDELSNKQLVAYYIAKYAVGGKVLI